MADKLRTLFTGVCWKQKEVASAQQPMHRHNTLMNAYPPPPGLRLRRRATRSTAHQRLAWDGD